jgi:NAD(P)-dependent dehydrogenase (short-subunit alcohol dehydrogenase family)
VSGRQRFESCVALVTGGAGAIGSEIARALGAEGAAVAVLDRRADAAVGDLFLECDVTSGDEMEAAIDQVVAAFGPPTHVVCAAGVVSESELAHLSETEWHRVVDTSLTGAFLTLKATLPGMAAVGRGAAVALSSGWGTKGYPRGGHYAAAKAGVEALVKSTALEFAPAGVRVNAVAPGPVMTPFLPVAEGDLDEFRRQREAAIPLGRLAEAMDVVGPVLFLLGEESSYVTGQVLHVNGGLLMP